LRVNQIVSGLALAIFGRGLANFIGRTTSPPLVGEPSKAQLEPLFGTGLADLPIVGPLIFGHDVMVYVSWFVVAAASYYLFHTRLGLSLRSVGENPAAADSAGLNVNRIRYIHVMVGGGLAGVAGAYIPLALNPSWADDATTLGWIAIALVIIAAWRPWRALIVCYLFGGMVKLGFTLQVLGVEIPAQFLSMIPFVATIIILILTTSGRRARLFGAPAALAIPYDRESR
jgi:simple sugar transport system permease protein